jgi:hypothetical protein
MTETCPCGASISLTSHDPYSLAEDFRTAHAGCWDETRISNHFDVARDLTQQRDDWKRLAVARSTDADQMASALTWALNRLEDVLASAPVGDVDECVSHGRRLVADNHIMLTERAAAFGTKTSESAAPSAPGSRPRR